MGAVCCCCFSVSDIDDHQDENDSNHGNCLCINCCIQSIRNKYGALFARGSGRPIPASNQGANSSDYVVPNNSSSVARSCDRTLQMNPNSRYSPVRRQEKGSNHSRVEPEPLINPEVQLMPRLLQVEEKLANSNKQRESNCSESSVKDLSSSKQKEVGYDVPLSEVEDECPICLEEYTPENPKIITQCSHHYHLGCIYEWMERSDSCPVCGRERWQSHTSSMQVQLMEFNETS